jgi:hypothetical protein
MELSLEFWYLFPVSMLIATIAMSTGIGGAVFFSPLFMLALKLEPKIAVGAALITELFGFSSGLIAYYKTKLIDFKLAKNLLVFSVPAAIVGAYYAEMVPPYGTQDHFCGRSSIYWIPVVQCVAKGGKGKERSRAA